jgi:1-acyl-sn-glycerol-3-phosphate acyltransferase
MASPLIGSTKIAGADALFYIKLFLALFWLFILTLVGWVYLIFSWGSPNVPSLYAKWMARGVMKILGIEVEVRNRERIYEATPCIIVGNHQSNLDVVTHGGLYPPKCVAIGKKELAWIPIWGQFFKYTGNILLDRKNPEKARSGIEVAKRALLEKGKSIYIFPEGTRSHGAEMGPFKKGAFHMAIAAGVPVVPVVSSPTGELFDEKRRIARPGKIEIQVMEPIPTKGMTIGQVDELMKFVRERMMAQHRLLKTIVRS